MKILIKTPENEQIGLNITEETNVLELLNREGFTLETPCGGKGICGKCTVCCLPKEAFSKPDIQEKKILSPKMLKEGIRLACRTIILSDCSVELLSNNKFDRILGDGKFKLSSEKPYITKFYLELSEDLSRSETKEYMRKQLGEDDLEAFSLDLSGIPNKITVVSSPGRIIRLSKENPEKNFGIAIDIGTTTVVVALVDMNEGKQIDTIGALNSQRKYGHDVISRISYASSSGEGFKKMRNALMGSVNDSIQILVQRNELVLEDIEQFVIAGNTTMSHFFFGFPVEQIAVAPYKPYTYSEIEVSATELGEAYKDQAEIYGFPVLSAFVGGDIVSGILFTEQLKREAELFVDLGTNGEIVYTIDGKPYCCSTAAGPAFEGANISCGTGNIEGAIESISITDGEFNVHTVGKKEPRGICGTGLISIVAEFLKNGIIERSGRFNKKMNPLFLDKYDKKEKRFWLSDNIFVSQKDIRNFQLAKSAIRTGIEVLRQEEKINPSTIKIAGGFSNGLRIEDLYTTGMIPPMNSTVEFVGNTSLLGGIKYLLDRKSQKQVKEIVEKAVYIELSNKESFRDMFVDNLGF